MAKRYSVDFEHFESAMLTDAQLGWQLYCENRYKMDPERRLKLAGLLKRFNAEMKSEIDARRAEVLEKQRAQYAAGDLANGARPALEN